MTTKSSHPRATALYQSGELETRRKIAVEALASCQICPHRCQVNRLEGKTGKCRTGRMAKVASYNAHFGEEAPLTGSQGSGTIFFSQCNLGCTFCQNYEISHRGEGATVSAEQLADVMLYLQHEGCHNINFVTPTHVVPQILEALVIAIPQGLQLPLVYNTSAYDCIETLQLLEGVIDVYMPDFKFWNPTSAKQYTSADDYPEVARKAIMEMHRQVGDLQTDQLGLAVKGLLVRHLVMPGGEDETKNILRFLAENISRNTYTNIMDQYRPCGSAVSDANIGRRISPEEYETALSAARELGMTRLDERDWSRIFRKLFC